MSATNRNKKAASKPALVIVESPTKVKTIGRYLGPGYIVKSSVGHIRDLPKSGGKKLPPIPKGATPEERAARKQISLFRKMGIDPTAGWQANYELIPGKEKVLKELKAAAKQVGPIYLATDLDREGEAIAWHLKELLGGDEARFLRVTFDEITKHAIEQAFSRPESINQSRVEAQQARRFLDRVVGFMASPLLWKKVGKGLSAGRVQSVALRLVVEREREIKAFIPEEYWEIKALLNAEEGEPFEAQVVKCDTRPFRPSSEKEALASLKELKEADYLVRRTEAKIRRVQPYPPFTTSTLQQAASVRLGYGVKKTMRLAQRLYEAGFITYMRTDSTNLSQDALKACRHYIQTSYGASYLPEQPRVFANKKRAQEAHEAIRPSEVTSSPDNISGLDPAEGRLYELIWRQFVACQMPAAVYDVTSVDISAGRYDLRARGRRLRFDGWLKVIPPKKNEADLQLPPLGSDDALKLAKLIPSRHFTKPPARYTEASLVKELTKRGIGRPSTYASIISTIQDRGYVRLEKKRLYAEKIGEVVSDRLLGSFNDLMDYSFTARLEEKLDDIAAGRLNWKKVLDEFYREFTEQLSRAESEMPVNDPIPTEIDCPRCARKMHIRTAATGVFLGCSGYSLPKDKRCTQTLNLVSDDEVVEVGNGEAESGSEADSVELRRRHRCPLCGSAMDGYLVDEGHKLHVCGRSPECLGTLVEEGTFKIKGYDGPILECDKCGSEMELRSGRFGKYFKCRNSSCTNTRKLLRNGEPAPPKADPVPMPELKCEKSDGYFVLRDGAAGIFLASSKFPRSKETKNPEVADLIRHQNELDPKFIYLCSAPVADPDGNPVTIRFHRKTKKQYVASMSGGKPTGWSAEYEDGQWVVKQKKKISRRSS